MCERKFFAVPFRYTTDKGEPFCCVSCFKNYYVHKIPRKLRSDYSSKLEDMRRDNYQLKLLNERLGRTIKVLRSKLLDQQQVMIKIEDEEGRKLEL